MVRGKKISNSLSFLDFSKSNFRKIVQDVNFVPDIPDIVRTTQIDYLSDYLKVLGTKFLVVESYYIDRHYMEEFKNYYSTCFRQCNNYCTRIHAFKTKIDRRKLSGVLRSLKRKYAEIALNKFTKDYLGYIVVRPIPSAPIGRTVLRPLSDDSSRHFHAVLDYSTHLAGIPLTVRGLAFQQQDQGIAACATTAVWTALQRVIRVDGGRAPTPSEITEKAIRYLTPGRPYPSSGLTIEQICEAIRAFGFSPHVLDLISPTKEKNDMLRVLLHTYLHSGIPIIFGIQNKDGGHAVTAVGYQYKSSLNSVIHQYNIPISWAGMRMSKVYVHDDRLGPYAKSYISTQQVEGNLWGFNISIGNPNATEGKWLIRYAIVPLYPKIRISAKELFQNTISIIRLTNFITKIPTKNLEVVIKFCRAGEYQKELINSALTIRQLRPFLEKVALSRYVGVVEIYHNNKRIIDYVWDTTDRLRSHYDFIKALLAIVCYDKKFSDLFSVPARNSEAHLLK